MGLVSSGSLGFALDSDLDLGSAPSVGDIDFIGINSDTTVATPSGFTLINSAVANQGSYIFYRQAVGGETDTVPIDLNGSFNATAVWCRIDMGLALDGSGKATAAGSSSGTSPTASTGTLAESGEIAIAFAGLHRFATGDPTDPVWANGFTSLESVVQGSGTSGCAAFLAYKENVGTSSESASVSWTNGAFDRDTYVVTFTIDPAGSQTVYPVGITTAEAFGDPTLLYDQTVSPSGIASGEAFGIPLINDGSSRSCMDVQGELNRIAGTFGLGEAGAANVIAGTTGLDTVGALNTYLERDRSEWLDLQGVANAMANTAGLGTAKALSLVNPV